MLNTFTQISLTAMIQNPPPPPPSCVPTLISDWTHQSLVPAPACHHLFPDDWGWYRMHIIKCSAGEPRNRWICVHVFSSSAASHHVETTGVSVSRSLGLCAYHPSIINRLRILVCLGMFVRLVRSGERKVFKKEVLCLCEWLKMEGCWYLAYLFLSWFVGFLFHASSTSYLLRR